MATKARFRTLAGWLVVDKPAGLGSRTLSNIILGLSGHRVRVGHCGTLDPMATGVLPLAINSATKLVPYLPKGNKRYTATVKFGVATDSCDITGSRTAQGAMAAADVQRLHAALAPALRGFVGDIMQAPPMHSAIRLITTDAEGKKQRTRAYEIARGESNAVDAVQALPPRKVHIEAISAPTWCCAGVGVRVDGSVAATADDSGLTPPPALTPPAAATGTSPDAGATAAAAACQFPEAVLSVTTGPGVYVRSLANDVGAALGVPSTLVALSRESSSGFSREQAIDIYKQVKGVWSLFSLVLPVDTPFMHLPAVVLSDSPAFRAQAVQMYHRATRKAFMTDDEPRLLGQADSITVTGNDCFPALPASLPPLCAGETVAVEKLVSVVEFNIGEMARWTAAAPIAVAAGLPVVPGVVELQAARQAGGGKLEQMQ